MNILVITFEKYLKMRLFKSSTADFIHLTFLLHRQAQLSTKSWDSSSFLHKLQVSTPVHNDADVTDDADNYKRVIGIALLKAFS